MKGAKDDFADYKNSNVRPLWRIYATSNALRKVLN